MKKKLFGKNISPKCSCCAYASFENDIYFCSKGKKNSEGKCRTFKYDPLMRIPKANSYRPNYSLDDFKF